MNEQVVAEMVGTIAEVSVEPGDRVAPGDTLVLIESMKMEIPVLAEHVGTVAEVAVKVGDVLGEGDRIAVIARD